MDPARLAHVMRGDRPVPTLRHAIEVAAIAVPTLILAWTGDPVHPVATADELGRLLPHAERHDVSTAADIATWTERIAAFIG